MHQLVLSAWRGSPAYVRCGYAVCRQTKLIRHAVRNLITQKPSSNMGPKATSTPPSYRVRLAASAPAGKKIASPPEETSKGSNSDTDYKLAASYQQV